MRHDHSSHCPPWSWCCLFVSSQIGEKKRFSPFGESQFNNQLISNRVDCTKLEGIELDMCSSSAELKNAWISLWSRWLQIATKWICFVRFAFFCGIRNCLCWNRFHSNVIRVLRVSLRLHRTRALHCMSWAGLLLTVYNTREHKENENGPLNVLLAVLY